EAAAPRETAVAATTPAATAIAVKAPAPRDETPRDETPRDETLRVTHAPRTKPKKKPLLAAATALTLAIAAGYVFVSTTFTFPPASANAASEVVDDAFAPYFSQRWDVFAPNMLKVNSALQIQVQWREDDGLVHSDWVDVTGAELEAVDGNPMPSRIAKSSANAAVAYITRFDELTDAQKSRVQDTFIERTDDGDFQPIPDADLIAELEALGEDDTEGTETAPSPVPLLRYDYMLIRFATAYGEAYFDREVERVRWRVQFDRPNDFEHRNDTERQSPLNELEFGWRQPASQPSDEAVAIFDDVIERYDR
ncbi:DUF5819 family protein, partial [Herbiconiux sp. CPCC 203406]